jgi:hypothetical protein
MRCVQSTNELKALSQAMLFKSRGEFFQVRFSRSSRNYVLIKNTQVAVLVQAVTGN